MTFLLDRSGPDYSRSRPCVCAMSLLGDLRESGSIYTGVSSGLSCGWGKAIGLTCGGIKFKEWVCSQL